MKTGTVQISKVTGLVDRVACAVSGARVASNRALARKNAIRAKFDRVRALIVLHSGDYRA